MSTGDDEAKPKALCGDPRCHITYIPHEATPTHVQILDLVEEHRGVTKSWLTAEARVVYGNMEFGNNRAHAGRRFGERTRPAWFTPQTWAMYIDAEQRAIHKRRQRMLAYGVGVGVLLVLGSFLPGSYMVQAIMGGTGCVVFAVGAAWLYLRASAEAERLVQVAARKRLSDSVGAIEEQRLRREHIAKKAAERGEDD